MFVTVKSKVSIFFWLPYIWRISLIHMIFVKLYLSPIKPPGLFGYEGWGWLSLLCFGLLWSPSPCENMGWGNKHICWQHFLFSFSGDGVGLTLSPHGGGISRILCPIGEGEIAFLVITTFSGRRGKAVSGEIDEFNRNVIHQLVRQKVVMEAQTYIFSRGWWLSNCPRYGDQHKHGDAMVAVLPS